MAQGTSDDLACLFRRVNSSQTGHSLFRPLTVVVPPSAQCLTVFALIVLLALGSAAAIIEVPIRVRATGILMPADGFTEIVAVRNGTISAVVARDGQDAKEGETLLTIVAEELESSVQQEKSLQIEKQLTQEAAARNAEALSVEIDAIGKQIDAARQRIEVSKRQLEARREVVDSLDKRLARTLVLAQRGFVAREQADNEQALLAEARISANEVEQRVIDLAAELDSLRNRRSNQEQLAVVNHLEASIRNEQLTRQLSEQERVTEQSVAMPTTGVIARVLVKKNDRVVAGQALVRIFSIDVGLEAWLYVAASDTRTITPGQSVHLQIESGPQHETRQWRARINKVSEVALRPEDVVAPVKIPGSVFEVRADLRDASGSRHDGGWQLAPGTLVRASILLERTKLYRWMLRRLAGESAGR